MRLILSIATRGRPQQIVQTVKRNQSALTLDNSLIYLAIDDDDVETIEKVVKAEHGFGKRVVFDVRAREDTVAAKWNRARQ